MVTEDMNSSAGYSIVLVSGGMGTRPWLTITSSWPG